jgi:hypothetical protein
MKKARAWLLLIVFAFISVSAALLWKFVRLPDYATGDPVDSLNSVVVYYNGGVGNVSGRNVTADGYNLGLKYQCVEFVKRYYYQHLGHKMSDSYGHAKDFFDPGIADGALNTRRGLIQFTNRSRSKPQVDDLLIFEATSSNPFGHVAIVSAVTDAEVEIIQQNPGMYASSRATYVLDLESGKWKIKNSRILGWLRK